MLLGCSEVTCLKFVSESLATHPQPMDSHELTWLFRILFRDKPKSPIELQIDVQVARRVNWHLLIGLFNLIGHTANPFRHLPAPHYAMAKHVLFCFDGQHLQCPLPISTLLLRP